MDCLPINPILLPDLVATAAFAARLADTLRPGDVVLLDGELGAGKTALARAVLRHLTADPSLDVPSPSYTLVQTYETPIGPVHHMDLWRLDDPRAIEELGWENALADVVLLEWPDRLGTLAPPAALRLHIGVGQDDTRVVYRSGWPGRRI